MVGGVDDDVEMKEVREKQRICCAFAFFFFCGLISVIKKLANVKVKMKIQMARAISASAFTLEIEMG